MNIIDIIFLASAIIAMAIGLIVGAKKGIGNAIIVSASFSLAWTAVRFALPWVETWEAYPSWLASFQGDQTGLNVLIFAIVFASVLLLAWALLKASFHLIGFSKQGVGNHVSGLLLGAVLVLNIAVALTAASFTLQTYLPGVNAAIGTPTEYAKDSVVMNILSRILFQNMVN